MRLYRLIGFIGLLTACTACIRLGPYGDKNFNPVTRTINPADVALPEGYKLEAVAQGLTYPSAITFDENGTVYVLEAGYSYGEDFQTPRLLRINPDGSKQTILEGDPKTAPWNGVTYRNGYFYIAEGGETAGGNIVRVSRNGERRVLIANLPTMGDHHTNGPVISNDNYLYFSTGTATNSGVVGEDNFKFGWLKRHPNFHDIPCQDITLTGRNYTEKNVLADGRGKVTTGAFLPYGTPSTPNQVIKGQIPCSGAVMRIPLDGGQPELVAWGFRNPFGLLFHNNQLYLTDNGFDDRGSRPVWAAPDFLWRVERGRWYGWPDHAADFSVQPQGQLLASQPNQVPTPLARFGCHSSAVGMDFSDSEAFGYKGEVFVAQFGDQAPDVGKIYQHVGYKVVRVNPGTGVITDFAVNKGRKNGPASRQKAGGLERPVDVKFSPDDRAMYIADFGVMEITKHGPAPKKQTGVIWRITKQ